MCLQDMNNVTDKNMAKHVHCTYAVVGVKWDRSHVPPSINHHSSTIKDTKNLFLSAAVHSKIGISNYLWCKLVQHQVEAFQTISLCTWGSFHYTFFQTVRSEGLFHFIIHCML